MSERVINVHRSNPYNLKNEVKVYVNEYGQVQKIEGSKEDVNSLGYIAVALTTKREISSRKIQGAIERVCKAGELENKIGEEQ